MVRIELMPPTGAAAYLYHVFKTEAGSTPPGTALEEPLLLPRARTSAALTAFASASSTHEAAASRHFSLSRVPIKES